MISRYIPVVNGDDVAIVVDAWREQHPDLAVFALLPEMERTRIGVLQSVMAGCGVPLFGAVFPALIVGDEFETQGVLLICLEKSPPVLLIERIASNVERTVEQTVEFVSQWSDASSDDLGKPHLFCLFDGTVPNIGTILHAMHERLGDSVGYAGANAGSERFEPIPCLFDTTRCCQDGVLLCLLSSKLRISVAHGYPTTKSICRATSTSGNRIDQIEGRPALVMYQELMKTEFGVDITPENFYRYAVHFPFGEVNALDVLVRIPVSFDSSGALHCIGEIPPNAMLRLLRGPDIGDPQCLSVIAKADEGCPPSERFLFYCAGRRLHFGERAPDELKMLCSVANATTIGGALSLGEIGMDPDLGHPVFHNAAIVSISQ